MFCPGGCEAENSVFFLSGDLIYLPHRTAGNRRVFGGGLVELRTGQCDVCLSHRATDTLTGKSLEELKKKITELLAQKPHTPAEIAEKIEAEKERVSEVIQYLLEEGEWKMQDGMIHISK